MTDHFGRKASFYLARTWLVIVRMDRMRKVKHKGRQHNQGCIFSNTAKSPSVWVRYSFASFLLHLPLLTHYTGSRKALQWCRYWCTPICFHHTRTSLMLLLTSQDNMPSLHHGDLPKQDLMWNDHICVCPYRFASSCGYTCLKSEGKSTSSTLAETSSE